MSCKHMALVFATAGLALAVSAAPGQEWTCPPADKVGLTATSPGWIAYDTLMYPYQAPALRFDSMEISTHGPAAVCKYRVANGLLSMWKLGSCQAGKGRWTSSGPKSTCQSDSPDGCSLVCSAG